MNHFPWCPRKRALFYTPEALCYCKVFGYAIALFFGTAIAPLELWGSHQSRSLALLGDAIHVISDFAVYGAALFAEIKKISASSHAATLHLDNTWGGRIAIMLKTVAVALGASALVRILVDTTPYIDAREMLFYTSLGLAGNLAVFFVLKHLRLPHGSGDTCEHGHREKHLHKDTVFHGASWHNIADTGISVIALCAALGMTLFSGFELGWLDSLATASIAWLLWKVAEDVQCHIASRNSSSS